MQNKLPSLIKTHPVCFSYEVSGSLRIVGPLLFLFGMIILVMGVSLCAITWRLDHLERIHDSECPIHSMHRQSVDALLQRHSIDPIHPGKDIHVRKIYT